jgi:hypothetical protein
LPLPPSSRISRPSRIRVFFCLFRWFLACLHLATNMQPLCKVV